MRLAVLSLFSFSLASPLAAATDSPSAPVPQMEVRKAIVTPAPAAATAPAAAPAAMPTTSTASPTPQTSTSQATPAENKGTQEPAKPEDTKLVYVRCEVAQPVVALTFDDGPHPDFTPRLLDTLKKEGIKATFFMVGRCVVSYPNVVKRIVDEGHEIASHSWSHPLLTSLSNASLDSQMQRTHDAIIKACGVTPTLYRPPYGASRLSQRKRIHDSFGYLSILWDVDPLDWQPPRNSQKVHDRILAQTRAGSIILCHDIHETTVDAMPATIADLKARGFQFMTVTQLIDLEKKTPRVPGAAPLAPAPLPAPLPVMPQPAELPPVKLKPSDRLSLDLPGEGKP